jgi:hypothetical protein
VRVSARIAGAAAPGPLGASIRIGIFGYSIGLGDFSAGRGRA